LRRFVTPLLRLIANIFFRRIEIIGWEKVPAGPVILVVTEMVKLAPAMGPVDWLRTRVDETTDMVSVISIQARYITPVGSRNF